jgi:trigger factor
LFAELRSLELATSKDTAEVTAMTGDYTFTINDITRSADAEVDQAFFDKVLGGETVQSEAEFRTKLSEIIQENYKREAEFLLQDDIVKTLQEAITIELPDEFLKRWLLDTQDGKFTAEEIEKDYDKFAKDLRWTLIKNKVAENADIKVDYAELLDKTKGMFRSQFGSMNAMGMDDQMEGIIDKMAVNYLTDKDKKGNMQNIFNRVYADKVMGYIQQNISVESVAVDMDEFKKVANIATEEA